MAKKVLIILDPGHGNNTPGKRSPVWADGRQLFEHEFNWDVVERIKNKLVLIHEDIHITRGNNVVDVPLSERVSVANSIAKNYDASVFVSVHANAGGGTGWEVFTSVGQTTSDKYATIFYEEMQKEFPNMKFRKDTSDGDVDKESQFYVLKNTHMPAVLTENFFMDTLTPDCELIMSNQGREKIAEAHIRAIVKILNLIK